MTDCQTKKSNQAIQIDQSIEYNLRNICLQIHAENKAGRLVPDIFLFLRKALYKVKVSIQHLIFNIFDRTQLGYTIRKTL